ncbi:MAG: glycerophosphodiester phosphodiesterase family protein [Candidatus Obscuribacterales bacterium]
MKVFAHRGGREWAPENTLAAFKNCLELSVDVIDLDIQRCASGELIVLHDQDLGRTTNGAGMVADVTFDEIRRLSAGLWFDIGYKEEKVPLLSEVLDVVAGKSTINIEIKNAPHAYTDIEEELLSLLSDYSYRERVIVSCSDHYVLQRLRQLDSEVQLAMLADGVLIDMPKYAIDLGVNYLNLSLASCRADIVEAAHEAGLKVNGFTANGRRAWLDTIKMGVDGIITDDPAELMVLLGRAMLLD